jgi:hypothetical protein
MEEKICKSCRTREFLCRIKMYEQVELVHTAFSVTEEVEERKTMTLRPAWKKLLSTCLKTYRQYPRTKTGQ